MEITTGLRILLGSLALPFGVYFLTDAWKRRSRYPTLPSASSFGSRSAAIL